MIGIIDYDSGHIRNLASAIKRAGGEYTLINTPPDEQIDKLIIYAGIKASEYLNFLEKSTLDKFITSTFTKKTPILAINNGLHVLYDSVAISSSHDVSNKQIEPETVDGLHLIPGKIRKLDEKIHAESLAGWKSLKTNREFGRKVHLNLLREINVLQNAMFYLNQTDYVDTADLSTVFAFSNFSGNKQKLLGKSNEILIPAIINYENIWGIEFLPEKSERIGIRLLRNFVNFVPSNNAEDIH
ncbi:MAG: hypothetical protein K8S87_07845 [Planctomycetes bacterium]|nr:hypothetical protein [Planctomycetota bacterium]